MGGDTRQTEGWRFGGGTVRRISGGEGWIDSEGWEFKGERETES